MNYGPRLLGKANAQIYSPRPERHGDNSGGAPLCVPLHQGGLAEVQPQAPGEVTDAPFGAVIDSFASLRTMGDKFAMRCLSEKIAFEDIECT